MTTKNEKIVQGKTIITPRYVSQIKNVKKNYSSLILERLAKKEILRRIQKGKYTDSINIYSIATNLVFPSYLSFWSGIAYKGYTEQILNTVFIATTKKTRNIDFEGYKIRFIKLSKKNFFGYTKELAGNEEIFIANNEKLLIDCLLYPKYAGNTGEIIKFIELAEFDVKKLKEYLNIVKNGSLDQKIGYLFEKCKKIDLSIKIKSKNYVFLHIKTKEKTNKKWRIRFYDN